MSRCKCPKSNDERNQEHLPYFEDITMKMEERHCDLLGRQKYLREKITTMERSIPALIAYNMWMTRNCKDTPYCKVREIMKKFVSYPDQTEILLNSLKNTVKKLNREIEELHEKIIEADVKLEETGMELESLQLANKEMNDILDDLEREVRDYTSPSLHSIHSEDLLCLSKIRQLAEEELNLKNCIKELEQKETVFRQHMERLLISKEYQNVCNRRNIVTSYVEDMECDRKRKYLSAKKCFRDKRSDQCNSKRKHGQEETAQSDAMVSTTKQSIENKDRETGAEIPMENVEKRTSWIPNWWADSQQPKEVPPERSADSPVPMNAQDNETEKSSNVGKERKKDNWSKSSKLKCDRLCFAPKYLRCILKKSCGEEYLAACNVPSVKLVKGCAMPNRGIQADCKSFASPCEICPSLLPCKDYTRPIRDCRCNCKGKCNRGLSDTLCNCNEEPLDPLIERQLTGSKQLLDLRREEESEDEFCECCSCGCGNSDESLYRCK
ncbi:uncharacterized protein LOC143427962 [Xylocopa sonorina]|uniref:uncharacterized protein LOC143427962 n=1 Tax=Xylocopa sonorina TaxID=1818115 RepID=UPI00403B13D2